VISLIGERLPATIELAIASLLIAILIGIPLGVWAGAKPSWADNLGSVFSFFGISMPSFWLGIMMIDRVGILQLAAVLWPEHVWRRPRF
jgi:peptide/nickel transport system permease protein